MTAMARTERTALCDLALRLGPEQPTLCAGWTVTDLVSHLVLRERSPEAIGAVVPGLSWLTDRAMHRLARQDFPALVERLRGGPPRFSPFAVPRVDTLANSLEFFVHHEDLRRAQPSWEPRMLSGRDQDLLWRLGARTARWLVRRARTGVVAERSDTGERTVLKSAGSSVVVRGLPGEVVLFLYGRRPQADVELLGAPADVAAFTG